MGKHSLDFTAFKHHSGTTWFWRKPPPKTLAEENGCILLDGLHNQLGLKPLTNHLYPTDHGLQERLVAGRCPSSVLGHGHQWLLPTRVPGGHPPPLLKGLHYFWTEIKTTRSGFQFWRNIYFLFNHTSTSAKFIPGNPVPKILQGLYFSNFHHSRLLLIPSCLFTEATTHSLKMHMKAKGVQKNKS